MNRTIITAHMHFVLDFVWTFSTLFVVFLTRAFVLSILSSRSSSSPICSSNILKVFDDFLDYQFHFLSVKIFPWLCQPILIMHQGLCPGLQKSHIFEMMMSRIQSTDIKSICKFTIYFATLQFKDLIIIHILCCACFFNGLSPYSLWCILGTSSTK